MASNYQGGTLSFKIGGVPYDLAGSFSYDIGGITREERNGPDGPHGTVGKYRAPMIDCEFQTGAAALSSVLQAIDGLTLTALLDSGLTFILYNASQVGDLVNDVVEAKLKCKFVGKQAMEF